MLYRENEVKIMMVNIGFIIAVVALIAGIVMYPGLAWAIAWRTALVVSGALIVWTWFVIYVLKR